MNDVGISYFFIPKGSLIKIAFFQPFLGWTNYIEIETEEDCYLSEKYLRDSIDNEDLCCFDLGNKDIFMVVERDVTVEFKPQTN